jgi:hypothetical protein
MRAHECRSLRHHGYVLRKGLLPPGFETVGVGIQNRTRLSAVQPSTRSEELVALWIQLLVRIHFVQFLPLIIEQDQFGAGECVDRGALTRSGALASAQPGEKLSFLKS